MQRILEKRERSLGVKLSIKGERCNSPKCALIRKPHGPGMHGGKHNKKKEFGLQMQEKQKIRFTYGLTDKQLEALIARADKAKEPTPMVVMSILERRLDNIVYRLGFTPSRSVARKMVSHGHFTVNSRKVTIPSYLVTMGETIAIREGSKDIPTLKNLQEKLKNYEVEPWLTLDKAKLEGQLKSIPKEVETPFDINKVVDYYSR
ncbi:MAG: 30S ribosomal protein S4 [Candidatus Colwellbacteria bacterium]|nr:30S ribosomal protein S4 [Candidatus Colwellbacteria bacterium]